MPSLWRLLSTPIVAVLAFAAVLAYQGQAIQWIPVLASGVGALAVVGVLGLVARRAVDQFLAGLEEAGVSFTIAEDVYGWLGSRTVYAETARGTWRVQASPDRFGIDFSARSPGSDRSETITGDRTEAGRRMANATSRDAS